MAFPYLSALHQGALVAAAAAFALYTLAVRRARAKGPEAELAARRRWHGVRHAEAVLLGLGLLAGYLLMQAHGWRLGYPRWLSTKLGLVAFLLVPLEGFRVYITLAWLGPGLKATAAPPFAKELDRARSMEDMLGALSLPLLVLGLPIVLWLSWSRPY
jgi:hypothetical protein